MPQLVSHGCISLQVSKMPSLGFWEMTSGERKSERPLGRPASWGPGSPPQASEENPLFFLNEASRLLRDSRERQGYNRSFSRTRVS